MRCYQRHQVHDIGVTLHLSHSMCKTFDIQDRACTGQWVALFPFSTFIECAVNTIFNSLSSSCIGMGGHEYGRPRLYSKNYIRFEWAILIGRVGYRKCKHITTPHLFLVFFSIAFSSRRPGYLSIFSVSPPSACVCDVICVQAMSCSHFSSGSYFCCWCSVCSRWLVHHVLLFSSAST